MLRDKCGQALQMESRRKAPNPPKAQRSGNRVMPTMARSGDTSDESQGSDLYGSNCRTVDLSPAVAYFRKSRSLDVLTVLCKNARHCPSFLGSSRVGSSRAQQGVRRICG